MFETDYTAEVSKPVRRLATALLVLGGLVSAACFVLIVFLVIVADAPDAPVGPIFASLAIFGLLTYGSVWMAYRLLQGQRSNNRQTVMPEWFIRTFGVPFLLGICATAVFRNQWFLGGGVAIAFAMIRIRSHVNRKQVTQADS